MTTTSVLTPVFFFDTLHYNELDFPGTVNSSPYDGYNTGQTNFDQNYEIDFVHFFTPSLGKHGKSNLQPSERAGPGSRLGSGRSNPLYCASAVPNVTVDW